MWKKMILCMALLLVVVVSGEVGGEEPESVVAPPVNRIIRKLGRGISNTAFGVLELPVNWYQVNFEEGGLAAFTYGTLRGIAAVLVREAVGVVEIVTFPVPLPGCSALPDSPSWGYGPILEPEWIVTPAQNKYNFIYPNQDTLP